MAARAWASSQWCVSRNLASVAERAYAMAPFAHLRTALAKVRSSAAPT